ncbi:MAG TPA: porin [Gemmatimonadales bacterium]
MHARPQRHVLPGISLGALVLLPGLLSAQAPNIRVSGRAQVQYRMSGGDTVAGTFNPSAVSNGFEVRRLRIQTDVRFGDNMTLAIQPSFEMGSLRMRDAYLRVGLAPQIGLTLGQEKSPFQRYELNSSNNLLSIERGVRILGLSNREALNDLLFSNGYVSHDLGAFLDYAAPGNKVTVKFGVSNGSRESVTDVNDAKSFFGRATAILVTNADDQPVVQAGVSFASRDRAICQTLGTPASTCTAYYADSSKATTAVGLDLEWGGFRPGWHVFADFATGDNVPAATRKATGRNSGNLDSASAPIVTFMGFHVVGAYRIATKGPDTRVVKIIEPALRLDYTDPNTDVSDDQGFLVTPVLNVYFGATVVARVGLDFYTYKDAAGTSRSAREFKVSWQANF